MLNFTINDKQLQVEEGKTVLEVAQEHGIKIPTLCYHKVQSHRRPEGQNRYREG
ncbi:MAG: 2Fe-2S iron-sulfur cluster-binding protein [Planctomycetota bacterium]